MTKTLATTLSCTFAPALIALVGLAGAPAFAATTPSDVGQRQATLSNSTAKSKGHTKSHHPKGHTKNHGPKSHGKSQ